MPPSRNQNNNGQDRRDRRPAPLSGRPERSSVRDESTRQQPEGLGMAQRVSQPPQSRSSTPRGDHSARRGRGGYSGVGGRGGSNRPGGSVHWNQSQPEPETTYESTTSALMTRVCAADGVMATKLTPTGLGGGFGNNWYAVTADKGLWIRSEACAGLNKMGRKAVEDNPGAAGFNITISPFYPEKYEAIDANHTQKIVMNNNFMGEDGKPAGLFGREAQAPSERKPVFEGECELCGSKKHLLANCVMRAYKGYVSGCPICNSCKHSVEGCGRFKAMSLIEKVKVLVQERANRPPVRTSTPWWRYLYDFCTPEEFVPGVVVGFPWSPAFCEEKGSNGLKKIQQAFDAEGDEYEFERDPSLSTFRQVFETHWKPAGMAWPAVLGPHIKSEDIGGQVIKTEPEA
ncbi:hypothetical protein F52700_2488 [Fusarium sp. NRRL 52700]|nr:hypothetical protein F52700_2488 [Fusarium sp. NRRL 52700]